MRIVLASLSMLLAFVFSVVANAQQCQNWLQLATGGPSSRYAHACAFDSTRGVTVLFGGWTGSAPLGDTWEWDGTAWQLRAVTGPPPRTTTAMAFDSGRNVVVLFGGRTNDGGGGITFGDTWEWDGASWMQRAVTGPPARSTFAMAYDSERRVTVLFGGTNGQGFFGDTWEWNGSQWTNVANNGPGRSCHGMAFDSARNVTMLFGGSNGPYLNDLWEWNGQTWSIRSTGGPTPRCRLSLCYDSARQEIVLYGGAQLPPVGTVHDTWTWKDGLWRQRTTAFPFIYLGGGLAFNSEQNTTLLIGPQIPGFPVHTWELTLREPAIENQPIDSLAQIGFTAQFSVSASGVDPMTYQWHKDGKPLIDEAHVSGSTTPILTIHPATPPDVGAYDVVVTNTCGETTSQLAMLSLYTPGDVNHDHFVNMEDVLAVVSAWGTVSDLTMHPADISPPPNGNGVVDIDDLLLVIGNWT